MKVSVLAVGKPRGALESIIREFEVRAARYWRLEIIEVESGSGGKARRDPRAAQAAEGKRLLARVPAGSQKWALTRDGSRISSSALAAELGDMAVTGAPGVSFLLGGAFGLDGNVLAEAHRKVSLSAMTLPHEIARLVLTEQLYRAGTILRNEPYHKGSS